MQQEYIKEVRSHFNEPILMCFDLARCVGYAEDDDDCYIIVRYPCRGLVWHTFVGGYYYLDRIKRQGYVKSKTGEDWDDFTRLDDLLEINCAPREKEFICIDRTTAV